ncbi:MAG: hypothetical protein WC834_00055 [Eubacteriales bacterium]
MSVTITKSTIAAFNTITTITKNAATADVDNTAEVFTVTPTVSGTKAVLIIGGTGSAADGNMTYSIAAGDFWAGKAVTGTVVKNTEKMIELETGNVLQDDGTIAITLTPAATDKLLTDHAAYMKFIELL